ncbi:hypothetical protein [Mesorhizobium abyssinicae]|uniref:hypothetical protein n=1 Tax=Mesorhizobium abyssinicae TaxID=1209958 RepID=UPI003390C8F2
MGNFTSKTIDRRSFLYGMMLPLVPAAVVGPLVLIDNAPTDNGPVGQTTTNTVDLTETDVLNLKKIASTEVVASLKGVAFTNQTHGVVDTILNRVASGKWGSTVGAVGNAPWQFSGINSNLKHAYGTLEKMPATHIKRKVALEVDRWLAARAAGTPSSVSNHLNYLNPLFSSQRSLKAWGWRVVEQAKKAGYVYGAGNAKHYHGTAPDLEKWRPKPFRIVIPDPVL